MAFLLQDQDEEERKKQGLPPEVQGAGGGAPGDGTGNPQGPEAGPDRQFTDVGAYLDANQAQAGDLGNKVVGQINDNAGKLRGDIDAANKDFSGRVTAGTTPYDAGLLDTALKDPTGFTSDPGNIDKVAKMRDASYTGPMDFSSLNPDLAGRVKSAADEAKGVDSPEGRKALLMKIRPNATAGQVTLDEMLIGGDKNARANMGQAAQQFGLVNDYLTQAAGSANTAAAKAKADTDATRTTVGSRLKEATGALDTDLTGRLTGARTSAAQKNAELAAAVKSGNLTPEQLTALGLTPEQWKKLNDTTGALSKDWRSDFDINPYLSAETPDAKITRSNVAGGDDYAREAALEKLTGSPLSILNNEESTQAGTAPGSLSKFDIENALGRSGGELSAKDQMVLDAFSKITPGIPGASPNVPNSLPFTDGRKGDDFYKFVNSVFGRNADKLSPLEKQWQDTYGPLFDPNNIVLPPGTPDPTAGNTGGPTNVRITNGNYEWLNPRSGQWEQKQPSKYENGKWYTFDPSSGNYVQQNGPPAIGFGGGVNGAV